MSRRLATPYLIYCVYATSISWATGRWSSPQSICERERSATICLRRPFCVRTPPILPTSQTAPAKRVVREKSGIVPRIGVLTIQKPVLCVPRTQTLSSCQCPLPAHTSSLKCRMTAYLGGLNYAFVITVLTCLKYSQSNRVFWMEARNLES